MVKKIHGGEKGKTLKYFETKKNAQKSSVKIITQFD